MVAESIVLHGLTAGPPTQRLARRLQRQPPRTGIETAETKVIVPVAGARWPRTPRQ